MNARPDLVEDVPLPTDGAARARAAGDRRTRQHRLTGLGAAAIVVVLVIGAAIAIRPGDQVVRTGDQAATAPDSSAGTTEATAVGGAPIVRPALLDVPESARRATPTIPAGWNTIVLGFVQISIPPDWRMGGGVLEPCLPDRPRFLVLGGPPSAADLGPHDPACADPPALVLSPTTEGCTICGDSIQVNGLTLEASADPCSPCTALTAFVKGAHVRIDRVLDIDPALVNQVLGTIAITPSAAALVDGPLADTSTWREVRFAGVTAWVPSTWPTEPVGSWNPCSWRTTVALSSSTISLSCAQANSDRIDGIRIHEHGGPGPVSVGDLSLGVDLRVESHTVAVGRPAGEGSVTVAVGADPTIARTILRTLTFDR